MTGSLVMRLAGRTLGRNLRRTFLSLLGVGIGCAVALFITAFMRGGSQLRVRSIAESGFGHLRLAPAGWARDRRDEMRLRDWTAALEAARALAGVRVAAPHARTRGLLAFGTRSTGVELLGVDPPAEVATNRLVRALAEGRYLVGGDRGAVVIGRAIAERLQVILDDELLLTAVGLQGRMEYAMLRVVGIVDTGSRDMDATICHVALEDVAEVTGLPGAAEVTVTLEDAGRVEEAAAALGARVPPGGEVLTWREVLPEQGGDARSDRAFMNLFIGVVVAVVVLGVTSAQLTAMLERRREFAVLSALGMGGLQMARLVVLEAVVLGLLGAAGGLAVALPPVYYTATRGIDFSSLVGGDLALSGVLFDPVFHSDMGWWMVPHALTVALASTVIASLYPAWHAARIDPTSALSLREG